MRSNRRLRQRAIYLAIALTTAIVAALVAVNSFPRANQRTLEVQRQALASAAQAAMFRGEPEQALALALAAIDKQPANPPDEVTAIVRRAAVCGYRTWRRRPLMPY